MDIKHFKLTNQEEIICEVVEWDNENNRDLVIRKSLKIEPKLSAEDNGYKYYTFTPWMAMQESLNSLQALNADQILAIATPSQTALDYFADVVNDVMASQEGPELFATSESLEDSAETLITYLH